MILQQTGDKTTTVLWKESNLLLIFGVTLCGAMGISLLTPIFPKIAAVFNIEREHTAWLITAYTLPGVFLAPLYGFLADRYGRKRVLIPLLVLFGLAGFASGFARTFPLLLTLRFVQGMGSGGLFTLNNTLIGDLYSGENRLLAMGYNSSVMSIATAVYPAVGGLLARGHWSAPLFLPVVAVGLAIMIGRNLQTVALPKQEATRTYLGSAFRGMLTPQIIALFVVSMLTFILSMGVLISFLPFWMSEHYQSSSVGIGVTLSLAAISGAVVSSQSMRIRKQIPVGMMIGVGFGLYGLAYLLIPFSPTALWMILPAVMWGMGQGINIPTVQSLLAGAAPTTYRGMFMAVNSTIILFGNSIGPLLAGMLYHHFGLSQLFWITGAIALTVSTLLFVFHHHIEPPAADSLSLRAKRSNLAGFPPSSE